MSFFIIGGPTIRPMLHQSWGGRSPVIDDIDIISLDSVELDDLVSVFNEAFADYFIPVVFSRRGFEEKIALEAISLTHSAGAVINGRLVGFVVIGIDGTASYNAGTGIIPDFRGLRLTERMYRLILPRLAESNIREQLLEVITDNAVAIRCYRGLGFKETRKLSCWKGIVKAPKVAVDVLITEKSLDSATLPQEFSDSPATWQNTIDGIRRSKVEPMIFEASLNDETVGYLVLIGKRIVQVAVRRDMRRKGIGTALFSALDGQDVVIANFDSGHPAISAFFDRIGLEIFVEQYEMKLELSQS